MQIVPDYRKSIVNLMSSIAQGMDGKTSYAPLKILPAKELKKAKNIVLLVIDGLGAEFIRKKAGKNSFFIKNKIGELTSVFPSTTTAAIPSFLTGEAPKNHGLVSWYMNMKEWGGTGIILRLKMRSGGKIKLNKNQSFKEISIFEKIKANSYQVVPKKLAGSEFNKKFFGKTKEASYNNLKGMFNQISKIIKKNKKRSYIYAYCSEFDHLAHHYGTESKKTEKYFKRLEKEAISFAERNQGKDMALLITADHGMIDSKEEERINLNKHKKLRDCLSSAVCGEPRAAICYVKPGRTKQFEAYARKKLGKYCKVFKSEELVRKGWLGRGKRHEKLSDRIGDYILIAKKSYILRDFLAGEKTAFMKGNHGGLSKEEMMVPLIYINSNSTSSW